MKPAITIILVFILVGIFYSLLHRIFLIPKSNTSQEKNVTIPTDIPTAVWFWESPEQISEEEANKFIAFCQKESIETVYLNMSTIIDISETGEGIEKQKEKKNFEQMTAAFIQKAKNRDIAVEALAGDTNWANEDYAYIPNLFIDLISEYNISHPETSFSGIHFDIEFYSQEDFTENQNQDSREYLELIESLSQKIDTLNTKQKTNLKLGFDLSTWLDGTAKSTKRIMYKNKNDFPIYHILDLTAKHKNNYIVFMAYINTSEKAISNIDSEFKYLSKNNLQVPLVIGQETGETDEKNTSYRGKKKKDFIAALVNIHNNKKQDTNYHGLAIHDLESFMEME